MTGRHIAACAVAANGQPGGVQAKFIGVLGSVFKRCVTLLGRYGVLRLGRVVVNRVDHRRFRAAGQHAHQAVVGIGIAHYPATAVDVENDREFFPFRIPGFDDAYGQFAAGADGKLGIDNFAVRFVDLSGLGFDQYLQGFFRAKGIERRRLLRGQVINKFLGIGCKIRFHYNSLLSEGDPWHVFTLS